MKFKSLTFGTVFLFLVMSSFSQTQKPVGSTTTPQKPTGNTATQTQQQKPAGSTTQQQKPVAAPAGNTAPQQQRTGASTNAATPAAQRAAAAAEADAVRADAARTAADGADMPELHLGHAERGGGRPLMEVLSARQSTRRFSPRELEPHIMGNLLWAANGVNREDVTDADGVTSVAGKRTAPSARDAREIDIYILTERGVYLYIPDKHIAQPIKGGDFRKEVLGKSAFAYEAPIVLVYVASAKKMEKFDPATKDIYAAVDCGFISQNVYLYCASEHLATIILGNFDKEAAKKVLGLKNDKALFAQPVGHRD